MTLPDVFQTTTSPSGITRRPGSTPRAIVAKALAAFEAGGSACLIA